MIKNFVRGCWRLVQPFRGARLREVPRLPGSLGRFFKDRARFERSGGVAKFGDLAPVLFDRTPTSQTGGGQYFFQDVWALRNLEALKPQQHIDVGSRIDGFVGQATALCPVTYIDIRRPSFSLPRLEFRAGSILQLPFDDNSVASLSCLHVVEHIGLGRYGDPIDPDGTKKALNELQRVLGVSGQLLFSMPIGRERIEFNAQRVWNPMKPLEVLSGLTLLEFSAVNDAGEFVASVTPENFVDSSTPAVFTASRKRPSENLLCGSALD